MVKKGQNCVHVVIECRLGSTNESSAPSDGTKCNLKIQVELVNLVCKTLVKPFNIRKFGIIDLLLCLFVPWV